MAVEPLFNQTKDALLTKVRIDPADKAGTLALVDQAIRDVRLGFFSRVGKTRSLAIAAMSYNDNPETDEEVLRAKGVSAENIWLYILLVERLPSLFMDNQGTRDTFNDEPLTRDAGAVLKMIENLKEQLDALLGDMILEGDDEASPNPSAKSEVVGPDTTYLLADNFIGNPTCAS